MAAHAELQVGDRTVRISNPDRVYFPARGETKLDLARYYMSVGDGIVRALRERPCMLHRFPAGVAGEKVHQKRLPQRRAAVAGDRAGRLPALRPARRRAVRHRAGQRRLGGADVDRGVPSVELPPRRHRAARRVAHRPRPHAAAAGSTPCAGSPASCARCSTSSARSAGRRPPAATACTSTCGSSRGGASATCAGPRWPSPARSSAARPDDVTTTWWRKDRDPAKLFVDYNQNARDHTIASAYSVRGVPEATVSTPITWDEIDDVDPRDVHHRHRARPASPRSATCTGASTTPPTPLDTLLDWADRDGLD